MRVIPGDDHSVCTELSAEDDPLARAAHQPRRSAADEDADADSRGRQSRPGMATTVKPTTTTTTVKPTTTTTTVKPTTTTTAVTADRCAVYPEPYRTLCQTAYGYERRVLGGGRAGGPAAHWFFSR